MITRSEEQTITGEPGEHVRAEGGELVLCRTGEASLQQKVEHSSPGRGSGLEAWTGKTSMPLCEVICKVMQKVNVLADLHQPTSLHGH